MSSEIHPVRKYNAVTESGLQCCFEIDDLLPEADDMKTLEYWLAKCELLGDPIMGGFQRVQ